MEKHIDFDLELKEKVIDSTKQISNSKIAIRLNHKRKGDLVKFRLTAVGKEEEIDLYIEEFNLSFNKSIKNGE
ncbi:hypothetical protein [Arenibacter algicola]|jgi:hypothetical protein|uniref:Uncharacterized protein n=1 Tax=Arenibacter algicola TaxID=616991 RepID=A0A221UXZ0_9FLAO|nr:hypothetical protein [Arenibacter algicola]ASO06038.1 hypothetical protein AREALGSMS7_02595 [Arenibacter algicola]|tara:strand:+ start:267 stop:485 length:219 start_codon:yes stop_codon:yes gene_type:complete